MLFFRSCWPPEGILAGSPRVGETGRWPEVVTIVTTASICQGGDYQLVCASVCVLSLHRNMLILERRVKFSVVFHFTFCSRFSLVRVL